MPFREVIRIDEEKCDGCGLCVPACAEGAIAVVDGKARLVSETYCDGLGACLGECPHGAITLERLEVPAFDAEAVARHRSAPGKTPAAAVPFVAAPPRSSAPASALRQWPVQLHLLSPLAPHFLDADLLLAADCVAFAVGDFHERWLTGRSLAIACPKLDSHQDVYLDKLAAMAERGLRSLTVMVMEVPCCSGLVRLAQLAVTRARRPLSIAVVVVGVQGRILGTRHLAPATISVHA